MRVWKSRDERGLINVRFCPLSGLKSDILRGPRSAKTGCEQSQQTAQLFDYLVGERQQAIRHREPERLGSLKVEHQVELRWLHNW